MRLSIGRSGGGTRKSAIEPGREHLLEITVDDREILAPIHGFEQLFAHAHERRRAAGSKVEPAHQLLAARLCRGMDLCGRKVRRRLAPGLDRGLEPRMIGAEATCQRLEEGNARSRGQLRISGKDIGGERDARGFAPPRQKLLAKLDDACRAAFRAPAPVAGSIQEKAAALRNALEKLAEKRGIHGVRISLLCRGLDRNSMTGSQTSKIVFRSGIVPAYGQAQGGTPEPE